MRTAVVALFAWTLLCQSAAAQNTAWADKLFGGATTHDFGTVPSGAQSKHAFKMTNIYKVPLEITNIRVSCDCLTATPTAKVLQPNETAYLNINMDGRRFKGHKSLKIYVTVGPAFISTATLNVSANARTDVAFKPGEIDFGLVQRGQSSVHHIDVEYTGPMGQGWAVSEIVKNATAPFELKVEELRMPRNAKGYRISAALKPDAPAGVFKQEIILKTNDPSSPVLTFNVLGNVQATLNVAPSNVEIAAVKVGTVETRRVVVRGSRPFRVISIDGQGDGLTALVPQVQAATQIIEIRFQPTMPGDIKKQLVIRTNLDNESATVVIEGSGTP